MTLTHGSLYTYKHTHTGVEGAASRELHCSHWLRWTLRASTCAPPVRVYRVGCKIFCRGTKYSSDILHGGSKHPRIIGVGVPKSREAKYPVTAASCQRGAAAEDYDHTWRMGTVWKEVDHVTHLASAAPPTTPVGGAPSSPWSPSSPPATTPVPVVRIELLCPPSPAEVVAPPYQLLQSLLLSDLSLPLGSVLLSVDLVLLQPTLTVGWPSVALRRGKTSESAQVRLAGTASSSERRLTVELTSRVAGVPSNQRTRMEKLGYERMCQPCRSKVKNLVQK